MIRAGALPLLLAAAAVAWVSFGGRPRSAPVPFSEVPAGTAVLATLDAPIPEGRNAVWCASFPMAWDRLKSEVVRGPVRIANAEEVARRLNQAASHVEDLPDGTCYAAAGFVKDGIVRRIENEMARRFPEARPEISGPPGGVVAYGYLRAGVRFTRPFFDDPSPLMFKDGSERVTPVASFGLREEDEYAYPKLREQVQVLHVSHTSGSLEPKACVLDLCRDSTPSQLLVALLPRRATLADLLEDLEKRTKTTGWDSLGPNDVLLVPEIALRLAHRFRELEGRDKPFQNPGFEGFWIDTALQTIQFTLNRGGAELASEAKVLVAPIPTLFIFDRPFLVVLRKRGAVRPYFALWVENAELLVPKN